MRYLILLFGLSLAPISAHASLLPRLGGTAYFDDVLNVTWLADANYAQTSGYDVNGDMTWTEAQIWIGALNGMTHLGANNWRLPTVVDSGTVGCPLLGTSYAGADCGYNVQTVNGSTVFSEMAHLFYVTLGNQAEYDSTGASTGCNIDPPFCLENSGPFVNLAPESYWSATAYAGPVGTNLAFVFDFANGYQQGANRTVPLKALAVRTGDIQTVPLPAAAPLLLTALGFVGVAGRRGKG